MSNIFQGFQHFQQGGGGGRGARGVILLLILIEPIEIVIFQGDPNLCCLPQDPCMKHTKN